MLLSCYGLYALNSPELKRLVGNSKLMHKPLDQVKLQRVIWTIYAMVYIRLGGVVIYVFVFLVLLTYMFYLKVVGP